MVVGIVSKMGAYTRATCVNKQRVRENNVWLWGGVVRMGRFVSVVLCEWRVESGEILRGNSCHVASAACLGQNDR